jgi:hypothetical protein
MRWPGVCSRWSLAGITAVSMRQAASMRQGGRRSLAPPFALGMHTPIV